MLKNDELGIEPKGTLVTVLFQALKLLPIFGC